MAPPVRIRFYGKDIERKIQIRLQKQVADAGRFLMAYIYRKISVDYRKAGRSKPGEYPRMDSGDLLGSLVTETEVTPGRITSHVGAGVSKITDNYLGYPSDLELKMNRSFMVRGLRETLSILKQILCRRLQ